MIAGTAPSFAPARYAGAGNLARRGLGDIETLTVDEYLRLGWRKRLAYRL
jgi:acyl-lipid omega-6 desaturase (Delta-12 desaturase)